MSMASSSSSGRGHRAVCMVPCQPDRSACVNCGLSIEHVRRTSVVGDLDRRAVDRRGMSDCTSSSVPVMVITARRCVPPRPASVVCLPSTYPCALRGGRLQVAAPFPRPPSRLGAPPASPAPSASPALIGSSVAITASPSPSRRLRLHHRRRRRRRLRRRLRPIVSMSVAGCRRRRRGRNRT